MGNKSMHPSCRDKNGLKILARAVFLRALLDACTPDIHQTIRYDAQRWLLSHGDWWCDYCDLPVNENLITELAARDWMPLFPLTGLYGRNNRGGSIGNDEIVPTSPAGKWEKG